MLQKARVSITRTTFFLILAKVSSMHIILKTDKIDNGMIKMEMVYCWLLGTLRKDMLFPSPYFSKHILSILSVVRMQLETSALWTFLYYILFILSVMWETVFIETYFLCTSDVPFTGVGACIKTSHIQCKPSDILQSSRRGMQTGTSKCRVECDKWNFLIEYLIIKQSKGWEVKFQTPGWA